MAITSNASNKGSTNKGSTKYPQRRKASLEKLEKRFEERLDARLEKLEDKFTASFSPERKNYRTRLDLLTKRLESIALPDSDFGCDLSTRIQATIDDLTDNLVNGTDAFGKLP